MLLNHLETIPHPLSVEKLSSMKPVPSAKVLVVFLVLSKAFLLITMSFL